MTGGTFTLDLPSDWSLVTVEEAGETVVGQQRSAKNLADGEQQKYLRVANIQDDRLDLSDVLVMGFTDPEQYRLRDGDILLCEGQSKELVGRLAMFKEQDEPFFFQNHLIRFRARDGVLPKYAHFVLRAYFKGGVFSSVARATTNLAHLGLSRFRELPFPIPPEEVQRSLAENARASRTALSSLGHELDLAKQHAAEVLNEARAERILAAAGSEMPNRLPAPGWAAAEDVVGAPILYGIVQPGPEERALDAMPYIRGVDLRDGWIDTRQLRHTSPAIAERYRKSELTAGDVVLGIIRNTRVAIVPANVERLPQSRSTARFRPGDTVDGRFLFHYLSSSAVQDWLLGRMRGIDMPGLNLRDIRKLPVPTLELAEQREIADTLDQMADAAERARSALDSASASVDELDSAISVETLTNPALYRNGPADGDTSVAARSAALAAEVMSVAATMQAAPRPERVRRSPKVAKPNEPDAAPSGTLLASLKARGPLRPEDAYDTLSGVPVEDFYLLIRDLVADGSLEVDRPDNERVILRLAKGQS